MYEAAVTAHQEPGAPDPSPAEDARILERSREDPAAFAPLYERYFPRIYLYCLRRVVQPEEAEDLASLVFTRALTGLDGYRGGSAAAWLFRIAHNVVANHLRSRRPHMSLDGQATAGLEHIAMASEPILEQVVRAEERQRVAHLIAALPDDQRELLALRVVGQLSARDIGVILGKSEGAVRVALYRIVQQLRAHYHTSEEE